MIPLLLIGMIKHSQSNKFSISLQYFKKEVRNRVRFLHADKHQSFYKWPDMYAKYLNRNLVILLQHITKKVSQLLLCSIVMQNIADILQEFSHVLCYVFLIVLNMWLCSL